MQNKKSILAYSLIASAMLAGVGVSANAATIFSFEKLGNGENLRTNLSSDAAGEKNFELKCGEKSKTDSTSKKTEKTKKGTDHKCGKDGKCGDGNCGSK